MLHYVQQLVTNSELQLPAAGNGVDKSAETEPNSKFAEQKTKT